MQTLVLAQMLDLLYDQNATLRNVYPTLELASVQHVLAVFQGGEEC